MKWKNLSKKKKAYVMAFLALVGILAWAFISAGVITHNFNRSQLTGEQDRQEALINGIILTETMIVTPVWLCWIIVSGIFMTKTTKFP